MFQDEAWKTSSLLEFQSLVRQSTGRLRDVTYPRNSRSASGGSRGMSRCPSPNPPSPCFPFPLSPALQKNGRIEPMTSENPSAKADGRFHGPHAHTFPETHLNVATDDSGCKPHAIPARQQHIRFKWAQPRAHRSRIRSVCRLASPVNPCHSRLP